MSRTLVFEPNIVAVGGNSRKVIFDERLAYSVEDLTVVENSLTHDETVPVKATQVLVVYAATDVEVAIKKAGGDVVLTGRFHILSGPGEYEVTNRGTEETNAKLIFG